ncbi:hypothetical protein M405DRAFT_259059 [Rhizopogon salebrosus TDB-379]|nr:hypothetical protein M405DRAFT_259059 [Rhizopogon salebrosus TDB-379]
MHSNYNLNCLVFGDELGYIFPIEIARAETVSHLKELIKEKKKYAFRDVDADRLDLWNVDLPVDRTLEHNINNLERDPKKFLSPMATLSNVFSKLPDEKYLHIIVQWPLTASPSPSVVPSFNLNCLILGDDPRYIFAVKVALTDTVGVLKKLIKDKQRYTFGDVDAVTLTLWKVDIHPEENEQLDLPDDAEKLKPVIRLSKLFPVTPENEHLHIMVQRPPILQPPQSVNPPAHSAQGQKC